ncbi:MAG: hypothetical protein ACLS49_04150 [Christensenellales bacterium]|jgi:hypothetical protein|nr:unknown [Clostridium sp. CAG:253]
METENKVISQNKTTNNNNKIINTNKTVNNIIKCQQNYEYMIANFELYPKNKNIRNAPTIRTKDLTNNFVYSYISLTKQQIISFYEKKENKTFKYWIIFIISFLLTLPLALLEFAGLLDIIFFL